MSTLAVDTQDQVDLFLLTSRGQPMNERLDNLELDARLYGWPRDMVRKAAHTIRMQFGRATR